MNAPLKYIVDRYRLNRHFFIAGPIYDCVFFIFSPILALVLGIIISKTSIAQKPIFFFGKVETFSQFFLGMFVMAHLVIVVFRSHFNRKVFNLYPVRFTAAPVLLFIAMSVSLWVSVSVIVLTTWWDVYHSSLQTFGFGRIYDMKQGNSDSVGRQLDILLNLLLYAGPILAGASLMAHVQHFSEFDRVGSLLFTSIPSKVESHRRFLTYTILCGGILFLFYYLLRYWQFYQRGYRISIQKVALFIATGLCSIYTWGFNSFGQAFFIMNFFHALQYFAIVWWTEKGNLTSILRVEKLSWGKPFALVILILIGFEYGFWAELSDSKNMVSSNFINVIAIMHFWYDGFVWSVRRKMV